MAQNVADLINSQEAIFDNLKRICINYKKDSSTRKTAQYLEERLSRLNKSWEQFIHSHQVLEECGTTDIQYFTDDIYNKTKKLYEEVLQDILKRQAELPSVSTKNIGPPSGTTGMAELSPSVVPAKGELSSKFSFDDIAFYAPSRETRELTEKQQDLLRRQYCNFKAFQRAVEKIDLNKSMEKWELEDGLNILRSKWEHIEKANWELDYILQEEDLSYQEKYSTAENIYDDLRKKIQNKIWNNTYYEKSTPKIVIPDFYGNYNQWLTFRDLYIESVHNNPILSKAQKMQNLKTKLKGEAEKLVHHLGISAENYTSCWEIITHRYDNKRLLFTSYMNTLVNQPNIQQATATSVRRLHDVILECLNGLKNIGLDISKSHPIIVHLMVQKLDSATYNEYIKDLKQPREFPDLDELMKFLESKFMALEALSGCNQKSYTSTKHLTADKQPKKIYEARNNYNKYNIQRSSHFNKSYKSPQTLFTTAKNCPICKTDHVLMNCEKFLAMNIMAPKDVIRDLNICNNCLFSHGGQQCLSKKTCKLCRKPHHTLMHDAQNERVDNSQTTNSVTSSRVVNNVINEEKEVLLTTMLLQVKTADGNYINLRGLLDQGSQVSLITENAAQRLRLPRRKMSAVVSGVGSLSGNCKGSMHLECKSIHSNYVFNLEPLIMKKLMNNLPTTSFSIENWHYIENLKLADPHFNVSGPIDLLLGADIYSELILNGVIRSDSSFPIAQQTKVGWILCGNVKTFNCFVTLNDLENMSRFWETEDVVDTVSSSNEEQFCEKFYASTTERASDGRYVVQMPMKPNYEANLKDTRRQAIAQFLQLERKLQNNKELGHEYNNFINEYISMGHMKPVTQENGIRIYLPHHGVLKSESTTTKLRVVFNASYKTNNNCSLNDLMYAGPNLQKDMLTLLINWRSYRYVFIADIEKMYRHIWLNNKQHHLQTIVWRMSPSEPLQDWQLCTVTYGMKSAPYLAMRTLVQLAQDEKNYPDAANVLRDYFYMDDLVYGQDSLNRAKNLVSELIALLKSGGFNLRKWRSNEPSILNELPNDQKGGSNTNIDFKPDTTSNTKMLGMRWNQTSDMFSYNWSLSTKKILTKRVLLGEISKLYDPLGFLSPITIRAKLLFQKVWISKIDWDESLPMTLQTEWETLRKDLPLTKEISIPRWLQCSEDNLEIHGFCDASEKAYACVIYSRVTNSSGVYITTIITAKTKVAPLSKRITLPKMELCGALLLTKLMERVKRILSHKYLQIHCWSDSMVVLAWIRGDVNRWERYVANRVSQINNVIPAKQWRYVKSEDNPADCATRGLSPSQLTTFKVWWYGPDWLNNNIIKTNNVNAITYSTNHGLKQNKCCLTICQRCEIVDTLLTRYSNYNRVIRVLGWIVRFINKRNKEIGYKNNLTDCDKREVLYLSQEEILQAHEIVMRTVQREYFGEEMELLTKNKAVSTKSSLLKLSPFLDEKGLLRVKGRLTNSTLPPESKCPIILSAHGRVTELIIQEAHRDTLHGGARLTLAYLRRKYWIVGGSRTVKRELRQCIRCHRFKNSKNEQFMADLPKERVTPSRPFTNTGVDFTGHVDVKINKGRGVKTCKGYIAVFICMVTKAVHLELVSDLTTETFIAALKRMCARRGTPKHIFSDNGTNFVGAAKLLHEDLERHRTLNTSEFCDETSHQQIQWHFNAPLWPSAGGLWEAAVKSMKYHLHRVLGEQKLTFEQFNTLLTQIEACLNSRPLCHLTEDIEDLEYLSPGHFLIGGPLLSLPQEEERINTCLRNRWRLVEQMNIHIWRRWSQEYLHQLQVRSKWHQAKENLKEGSLVLIKDEHLPPGRWALGRVLELHPGTDGIVRVVTLKTKKGQLKRPISKLSPLPLSEKLSTTIETKKSEEKPAESAKHTHIKPRKYKIVSFILMIILAMSGIARSAPTAGNYKVTSIQSSHPIYFDEAGKLHLIHDEWTLLIYYNLTSYWQSTEKISTYISQMNTLCQNIVHEYQSCIPVIDHLRHELRHLEDYNSMLHSQNIRQKRGYFDGVGKLSRTLFGTLDVDFAEKYEKDIKILQFNDNYLLQLIKNQTLIVEAENNFIKTNTEFIDKQFDTIQAYMNQTSNVITRIENRAHMLYAMNDIHSAAVTSTLIISDLNRILELLMNALGNIYRGHLDTHLLSASQLTEQLNIISAKLPQGLSLPVKNGQSDFKNIYDLIHVKARITNNFFLFELHIPLLSDEDYKIYRIIPIPFSRQGHLKLVQSNSNFIAINFMKNSYITMDIQDMQQCTLSGKDEYICVSHQPVYNLHDIDAPCEAQVFSQQTSLSCVISDVMCKETWIKLHKPNVWLFILCDQQMMRVICSDQVTPAVITGTGVIALKPKCILQKKDATIFTYNHLGSQFYMNPDIDEPITNSTINNIFDLGWKNAQLNITPIGIPSTANFSEVDRELRYQQQHEILSVSPVTSYITSHDIYHYTVSTVLLGGIAAFALYIVIKRRKRKIEAKNNTRRLRTFIGQDNAGVDIEMREIQQSAPPKPPRAEPTKRFSFDELSS